MRADHLKASWSSKGVGIAWGVAACGIALVLLMMVLERVGIPVPAIAATLAGFFLLSVAASGVLAGTMRFPIFVAGGRWLPPAALGLALATASIGATQPASGHANLNGIGVAVGLLAASWLVWPALRRSGAPGLASFLGHRFDSPMLGRLVALLVAAGAGVLGAERLGDLFSASASLFGMSRDATGWLIFGLAALVLVPGGVRSLAQALLALGAVGLIAVAVVLWDSSVGHAIPASHMVASMLDNRPPLAWSAIAAAIAVTVLAPHLATVSAATAKPRDIAWAGPWAVLFGALMWSGTAYLATPPSLAATLAMALLHMALTLGSALALLMAAGLAIGFELPGRVDRRAHPTSSRFALLRLAVLASLALAIWAATRHPELLRGLANPASIILAGGLGAPFVLGFVMPRAASIAGIVACLGGTGVALVLLDGRLATLVPWLAALAGEPMLSSIASGVFCGAIAAAIIPCRDDDAPQMEDEAF